MKNLLVAQSGGPTATINSTVFGVFKKAKKNVDKIYGARFGIEGILKEDLIELEESIMQNKLLLQTPASILGSCRFKLKNFEENEQEYETILKVFRKFKINYFIYIGGNDSMDTAEKISQYFKMKNINDIFVIGAPKTIDNDLEKTDHCPGFGSAAKYVATTFAEIEKDTAVYRQKAVTIVETMGRDTGWLCASSALCKTNNLFGPCLICCCEKEFFVEDFLEQINIKLKEKNNVLVAISEGVKITEKKYSNLNQKDIEKDMFGHVNNAGIAKNLEKIIKNKFKIKTRSIELNTPQRAASHLASKTDVLESILVGEKAVELLLNQKTAKMVILKRKEKKEYESYCDFVNLSEVANKVRKMPSDFILKNEFNLTEKAICYLTPLIKGELKIKYANGIPLFLSLF